MVSPCIPTWWEAAWKTELAGYPLTWVTSNQDGLHHIQGKKPSPTAFKTNSQFQNLGTWWNLMEPDGTWWNLEDLHLNISFCHATAKAHRVIGSSWAPNSEMREAPDVSLFFYFRWWTFLWKSHGHLIYVKIKMVISSKPWVSESSLFLGSIERGWSTHDGKSSLALSYTIKPPAKFPMNNGASKFSESSGAHS